ncbi:MAG: hypothetical protein GX434_01955 [Peptococcaceae bacterium]|nr:hypothetical protein [Peptococcaceae bacterium]
MFSSEDQFLALMDRLYRKDWGVFCKKPFKSPEHVVRYLGRYTHLVALSNARIRSFDGKTVSFAWKDYKDKHQSKVMTLDTLAFTRRFLLHVLPERFVKICHYGLLCSRNLHTKLARCRLLARCKPIVRNMVVKVRRCRHCGSPNILIYPVPSSAVP